MLLVDLIEHQIDQIEPGEQRRGQVDIVDDTAFRIVFGVDGVGTGEYGCSRVQLANDARLSYTDGLLFHGLMENGARILVHFVELVNAADAFVAQHQCPTLQDYLFGLRILADIRGQPHRRGPLPAGIDTARSDVVHELQEL